MAGVALVAAIAVLAGSEWGPDTGGGPERFVRFEEARVSGHAGCNRFFGAYSFDGQAVKIGPLATTRMSCAPAIMEAERAWLGLLTAARTVDATHKTLVLRDGAGVALATLRRRDWD